MSFTIFSWDLILKFVLQTQNHDLNYLLWVPAEFINW